MTCLVSLVVYIDTMLTGPEFIVVLLGWVFKDWRVTISTWLSFHVLHLCESCRQYELPSVKWRKMLCVFLAALRRFREYTHR